MNTEQWIAHYTNRDGIVADINCAKLATSKKEADDMIQFYKFN